MKKHAYIIFLTIAILFIFYVVISWAAFQLRNPIANEMQFYRHFWSVVTWEKLDKFQEKD